MNCLPKKRKSSRQQEQRHRSRSRPRQQKQQRSSMEGAADMMGLARQGKFDEIHYRLNRFDDSSTRLGNMYITNPDEAAFPLHALLKFRPPVTTVDTLIRKLQNDCSTLAPGVLVPEEIREKTLHQTPLHVAVASMCSLEVIERLLQGESLVMPAMAKDGLHRFPLHWACALPHTAKPWAWQQRSIEIDYRWDVVHFLLEQYPVAVVIPDVYNQTPLDYAHHNKLHSSITELLEQAATEFEKYAPKKAHSIRENTEATSLVSESDHVPDELPVLIGPNAAAGKSQSKTSATLAWWSGDDVSSLGGDFPSQFSVDASTSHTMAHVTSLFSSALSFGKGATGESTTATTTAKLPSPPNTSSGTNATAPRGKGVPKLATKKSLLDDHHPRDVSENSSGQMFFGDKEEEDTCTNSSAAVRTKTLLRGNIQVKQSSSSKRNKTAETKRVCVPAVV